MEEKLSTGTLAFMERSEAGQPKIMEFANQISKQINDRASIDELMQTTGEMGRLSMEIFYGDVVDYDLNGLNMSNHYLHVIRKSNSVEEPIREFKIFQIGAFTGQILCKLYDGRWTYRGNTFGSKEFPIGEVVFPSNLGTDPFLRAQRQLDRGESSDLYNYHKGLLQLLEHGQLTDSFLMDVGEAWYLFPFDQLPDSIRNAD